MGEVLGWWREVGGGVVEWCRGWGVWCAVGVGLLVVAGFVVSAVRRRRAAAYPRSRVELRPSRDFDAGAEEIAWCATELGRASAAAHRLPARSRAVRVGLACEGGTLVYRWEGPEHGASVLRLAAYPGVEVLDPATAEGEVPRIRFAQAPPLDDDAGEAAATGAGETA